MVCFLSAPAVYAESLYGRQENARDAYLKSLPIAQGIVVYKAKRLMILFDGNGQEIKRYRISLGGNPIGHKEREGDLKTPEGLYFIEGRNPNSAFHLSLKISYPNDADRKRAEMMNVSPGGMIMIHGTPNDANIFWHMFEAGPTWTEGCIAVRNHEMEEIWHMVPDRTPIEIFP